MNPKRLLIIIALSLLTAGAWAQAAPDSSSSPEEIILGTTSPDLLLKRGDVRDDLHLSTEQSLKIIDIQTYVETQVETASEPVAEGDDSAPGTNFDAVRKYAIQQVGQLLTPDQMKRLKQIALQLTGYSALARPDVQKEIVLSRELAIQIEDLASEEHRANESVLQKYQDGDLTIEQFPEIIKKNRQTLNDEIGKILPQSVKDKFKSLGGRQFKAVPFR
jgi:DNA-directed RNA polymerase beta' subunit